MRTHLYALLASLYDISQAMLMKGSPERVTARWRSLHSLSKRLERLRVKRAVWYAYHKSPFYHRLFEKVGLHPSDIKTLDDFRRIPLTESSQLLSEPYQFLAVPKNRIFDVGASSGTTGAAKKVFFTRREVDRKTFFSAAGFSLLGVRRGDVAQVMWPPSPYATISSNDSLTHAFRRLGIFTIPRGTIPTPEEQIRSIQEYGVTLITGSPSYIHMLTVEGCKYAELSKLGVRWIFLSGEPWPESLRNRLKEAWNCQFVHDAYFMTEVGGIASECNLFNGLHLNEVGLYTEIVDPKTGEAVEGEEEGELVFTPFDREGTPLLRYRSGDVSRSILGPCECGWPTHRIARIKGRTDDVVKLGTSWNVYPSMIDSLIFEIPGILNYELVVTKTQYKDNLTFRVEVDGPNEDLPSLVKAAMLKSTRMRNDMEVSKIISEPVVEVLPKGSLAGDGRKAKRIIDLREK